MKNYGTLSVQRYEIFFILKNNLGEKEGWCVFVGKKSPTQAVLLRRVLKLLAWVGLVRWLSLEVLDDELEAVGEGTAGEA